MPLLRRSYRSRYVRYPSRRATTALKAGRYASYRTLRGTRKNGFRGRYPRMRRTVAGNLRPSKYVRARSDFPIYLPRSVTLRQEQKYCEFDVSVINTTPHVTFAPIGEAGVVQVLPLPSRGDALNMRLGDRVLINSVIIRGFTMPPQVIATDYASITCMDVFIIWDHSPVGVYPTLADLFSFPSGTPPSAADKDAMCGMLQNPVHRDRFSFLYRFRYNFLGTAAQRGTGSAIGMSNDRMTNLIDWNLNINKVTAFASTSTAGNMTAIVRGAPYIVMVANCPSGTPTACPAMQCNIRVLFADL